MKVFLTGASGVMARAALPVLIEAGHEVIGLVQTQARAEVLREAGVVPHVGDVFDPVSLRNGMAGCDAVINYASRMPTGLGILAPGSQIPSRRVQILGTKNVATVATELGVGRMVQRSFSKIYIDSGDAVIDESFPVDLTEVTEPVVMAEDYANLVADTSGATVNLRFGLVVGDDPNTRWLVKRARAGRPFGLGDPEGWLHVIHLDDVGAATLHALEAPSGVYNVGAEPLVRRDFLSAIGDAVGKPAPKNLPKWLVNSAHIKLESLARSIRVSSEKFSQATGWTPQRPELDSDWFDDAL